MKRLYQLTIAALMLTVLGLVASTTVVAQENTDPDAPTSNEVRTTQQAERSAVRCERVQQSLTLRVTGVTSAAALQTDLYTRLSDRINNVITGADNRGYPAEDLRSAQQVVAEKITAFNQAVDTYTASLATSSEVACEDAVATYREAIATSRQNVAAVRAAAQEVRTAFRQEVIPALRDFKAWLEDNQTGVVTSEPTTDEE